MTSGRQWNVHATIKSQPGEANYAKSNLVACNACFAIACFAMVKFGLFSSLARLDTAIVLASPIRTVVTLERIELHLTVLHAFEKLACESFEYFTNRIDCHDKSRTTSQVDCKWMHRRNILDGLQANRALSCMARQFGCFLLPELHDTNRVPGRKRSDRSHGCPKPNAAGHPESKRTADPRDYTARCDSRRVAEQRSASVAWRCSCFGTTRASDSNRRRLDRPESARGHPSCTLCVRRSSVVRNCSGKRTTVHRTTASLPSCLRYSSRLPATTSTKSKNELRPALNSLCVPTSSTTTTTIRRDFSAATSMDSSKPSIVNR